MVFSDRFYCATVKYNELHSHVAAPYIRKSFRADRLIEHAEITVCGLGFYRIWINGKEITKGLLAPYISNPDDIIYYDHYDVSDYIREGKNVFGFLLGNGNLNCPGGFVWDFEQAPYRSAPKLAFTVLLRYADGSEYRFEADGEMKTAVSPVYFDDLRCGERYDARKEIPGWNLPEFEDDGWDTVQPAACPRGEKRLCEAQPILPTGEVLNPVSIRPGKLADYKPDYKKQLPAVMEPPTERDGYIYDFGKNTAGIIKLRIKGEPGQRIELQFAEYIDKNGDVNYANIKFYPDGYSQRDVFICSGKSDEYTPSFTYHGFSCCLVTGLKSAQAKPELLTAIVCNSAVSRIGSFRSSDIVLNNLYGMACNSDLSNLYYFPTDCPHREKNGWTGDAALSMQHFFMNYDCLPSMKEWERNIVKSQKPNGSLPGIIPTNQWGYDTGPSWDVALVELPYRAFQFTGDLETARIASDSILLYLHYLKSRTDERGLVSFGLGDWCSVDWKQKASRDFTCSVTVLDLLKKAAFLFEQLEQADRAAYANACYSELRSSVRSNLVDLNGYTADTCCQTSQAMAIYYDVFDEKEKPEAFRVLLRIIHSDNDFSDVGILGARVLFHVLSVYGESALARKMIARPEWPSYGHWIEQGLTALSEEFIRDDGEWDSRNHHMFGDISNWFISRLAGLQYNPSGNDLKELRICPAFISSVSNASASYHSLFGEINVSWERTDDGIQMDVQAPEEMSVEIAFVDQKEEDGLHLFRSFAVDHVIASGISKRKYRIDEYLIRPLQSSDREGIQAFYDSLGERSTFYFNENHGNEHRTMEYFENGKPDHRFTVVSYGKEIAALAFIWDLNKAIPWFGICVSDRFQKRGLGSALLDHVLKDCKYQAYGGLILRTATDNLSAQKLYESHGFEKIGIHDSGQYLYLKRFERDSV